jgi:hypothetical protein
MTRHETGETGGTGYAAGVKHAAAFKYFLYRPRRIALVPAGGIVHAHEMVCKQAACAIRSRPERVPKLIACA